MQGNFYLLSNVCNCVHESVNWPLRIITVIIIIRFSGPLTMSIRLDEDEEDLPSSPE